ncbi:LysM peptidoglycan-binding domain-containing protein [Desulfosudis oleivorans]|uniref:Peptidoglycan-binding LysM n=1 Tax=Desulfosudis oleivorans (strain DSM 6200 / JCM 39069 / Hxd3) TaxID=96561 RepID=A8ZU35_DESOH|nr:LysM domain-containing protein [Desulfosudis oleivorans]ABW66347.1 Peptidoglycan-binding LysM [Desulfosudis oleivorans Hxd3]
MAENEPAAPSAGDAAAVAPGEPTVQGTGTDPLPPAEDTSVFQETTTGTQLAVEDEQADQPEGGDFAPGFYYTVRPGDTLWDLSRKFYDSEWVWPAMWGQNKDLTNPHLIYPGQKIRLYQKTDVPDYRDKMVPPPPPEEEVAVAQFMPEEQAAPEPPVEKQVYFEFAPIDSVGFIQRLEKTVLSRNPLDPYKLGKIFKVEGYDRKLLSQGDTIYIQQTGDTSFISGNTYRIYKPITPVDDPTTGKYVGHQYNIAGIAEITAVTPDFAVANIHRSFQEITVGDLIMPFEQRAPKIPLTESPEGLTGTIVGVNSPAKIFGEHAVVFINRGKKDGIYTGQRYEVYYQENEQVGGKKVAMPPIVYGRLLVLLTLDTTATVVVTNSDDMIEAGATFRSPL